MYNFISNFSRFSLKLPDLKFDFKDLEPVLSADAM